MNETDTVKVTAGSAVMSLSFSDSDPVASCHVLTCRWYSRGDSVRGVTQVWLAHLSSVHRDDWE